MKDCLGEETCLVKITGGLKLSKLLGQVIQSVVSLMSSLVVKMLTVLVSTVSNSQVFLLEKNVSSFCKCKSYTHFFSKNIIIYAIFNDQCFNDTLTNNIVSFEQLGSVHVLIRGMFEMNCLFLSGDFKFQVSPKVLISCPRNTPRG